MPSLSFVLPSFSCLSPSRRPPLPEYIPFAIIERAPEGILVVDIRLPDEPIIYVNEVFETITGYSRQEAVGKNCRFLQGIDRLQPEVALIREALSAGVTLDVRLRNYRKDGRLFWNDLHLVPFSDAAGAPTHYAGFIRDVTDAVDTTAQLKMIMHTDPLTKCLSRDALVEQLSALTGSGRVLLIKVDIARFHEINRGYGYDVGDALLRETALRLATFDADLVARVGSDQFALALAIGSDTEVTEILARLSTSLAARFALPGADLTVRFALGFVVGAPGAEAMTLVRQAGAALADSKASLLRRPYQFAAKREASAQNRLRMTTELQRALTAEEFTYHYQPQVDITSGRTVGAEALVRWQHPLFGLQQPGRFIGLAEETGLILDIGTSGLREIARFAASFNRDRTEPLCFSFNVSPIELTHSDIVSIVNRVVDESGADPAWLTLELTESLFAEDSPEILSIFHEIRDLGLGLSIDDFGTGYSSLRYIDRFPITEIKIDRSFVSDLAQNSARRVIVEAVIKLGTELGARVIAEGVEQEAERELLVAMGCAFAQGNLFSPPVPASELSKVAPDEAARA